MHQVFVCLLMMMIMSHCLQRSVLAKGVVRGKLEI